jgi:hypothetical protein
LAVSSSSDGVAARRSEIAVFKVGAGQTVTVGIGVNGERGAYIAHLASVSCI